MPQHARHNTPTTPLDPRWQQVVAREAQADGEFYYAVKTTGIYCCPSCAARTPRPENVEFFLSCQAAEAAGYRACKRCKPEQASLAQRQVALVTQLCRQIETADAPPTLAMLAHSAQMSTFHVHRLFKKVTGITPKAYATAHRSRQVRDKLTTSRRITDAIYEAGYNTQGRFYAQAHQLLGMRPTHYRAGGTQAVIRFALGECSLGAILVAASERGVCAILLGDEPEALVQDVQDRFPQAQLIGGDTQFEQCVAQVVGFVEQPRQGLDLPLDIRGTAFQQRVWQALQKIPPGATLSYGDIAQRLGAASSARAVARACAANPLAVAIPCHRVVRSDGAVSGYRWGVERKRALLEREALP